MAVSLSFWPCRSREAIAASGVGKLVVTVNCTAPGCGVVAETVSDGLLGIPAGVGTLLVGFVGAAVGFWQPIAMAANTAIKARIRKRPSMHLLLRLAAIIIQRFHLTKQEFFGAEVADGIAEGGGAFE